MGTVVEAVGAGVLDGLPQADLPVGVLRMVPIEELHESEWNPRQYYPEAAMAELTQSMRECGFREWLPLMVRPLPDSAWGAAAGPRGYEIGAGHRRTRAARAAGITTVPCIVRPLTDVQFLDVLNFDNSGREDVHPLHEAAGWRVWMERTGKGVLDIAARIGQSKEYVYQRLKYAALVGPAQVAFLDGKINARHAILIARLQPAEQMKALKFATTADWRGATPSANALADHLHGGAYQDLGDCPFDRTDRTLLAGAGACEECPKRAANIPGFEFENEPAADLCTDRACYEHKVENHLFRIRTDLAAKLPAPAGLASAVILQVSTNWTTKKKGVRAKGGWEPASAGDKGAETALVVEGREIGKVIKVRVKARPAAVSYKDQEAARKKADEQRKVALERELAVRRKILEAVRPKIGGLTRADIEGLLTSIVKGNFDFDEVCRLHAIKFTLHQAEPALLAALPKMTDAEIMLAAVEASVMCDFADYRMDNRGAPDALLALAKRYKVDAAKIRSEMEADNAVAGGAPKASPKTPAKKARALKKLSPVARKRIAAAQRKHWAEHRKRAAKAAKK